VFISFSSQETPCVVTTLVETLATSKDYASQLPGRSLKGLINRRE
jgi:hypothetical protein